METHGSLMAGLVSVRWGHTVLKVLCIVPMTSHEPEAACRNDVICTGVQLSDQHICAKPRVTFKSGHVHMRECELRIPQLQNKNMFTLIPAHIQKRPCKTTDVARRQWWSYVWYRPCDTAHQLKFSPNGNSYKRKLLSTSLEVESSFNSEDLIQLCHCVFVLTALFLIYGASPDTFDDLPELSEQQSS